MLKEIDNYFRDIQEDRNRERANEAPYSALVVYHKKYYGKGWDKFFNFCKPVLIAAVVVVTMYCLSEIGLDDFMNNLTAWQLFGGICVFVMCVALGLDVGDSQDTEQTLIFTDKGLTVVIPKRRDRRGHVTPEKVVKYPPFAKAKEEEMAWSNFCSYSILRHNRRGNVSIKLWLVQDPKSGTQEANRLRKKKLDCVEIYLRDDGGKFVCYYDEKSELDAAVKYLNDKISLPFYSEEQVDD